MHARKSESKGRGQTREGASSRNCRRIMAKPTPLMPATTLPIAFPPRLTRAPASGACEHGTPMAAATSSDTPKTAAAAAPEEGAAAAAPSAGKQRKGIRRLRTCPRKWVRAVSSCAVCEGFRHGCL